MESKFFSWLFVLEFSAICAICPSQSPRPINFHTSLKYEKTGILFSAFIFSRLSLWLRTRNEATEHQTHLVPWAQFVVYHAVLIYKRELISHSATDWAFIIPSVKFKPVAPRVTPRSELVTRMHLCIKRGAGNPILDVDVACFSSRQHAEPFISLH